MAIKMISKPVVLSIAGSDSGGGAGIQADLKTFQSIGVFGTTAITCITAQNPSGVTAIQEITEDVFTSQLRAVLDYFPIKFVKTGMLFSKKIIEIVSKLQYEYKFFIIMDPVMVATSGAKLLKDDAIDFIKDILIPQSILITPNLDEASLLLNEKINQITNYRSACEKFYSLYKVPILLKGGHLPEDGTVLDLFYDGKEFVSLPSKYLDTISTHGTGCTYSSAITAYMGLGNDLKSSIQKAKLYLSGALESSYFIGKISTINHNYSIEEK
jgi:hydroxymethylpyrimidine/phosphomethylpyrimidine kinase